MRKLRAARMPSEIRRVIKIGFLFLYDVKRRRKHMELPRDISRTAIAVIAGGLILVTFFAYRGYVNSRKALEILEIQAPNITRVAFDTQVFALTPANLEP